MKIKLLTQKYVEDIKKLYDDIKKNTYTLWDDDYPSEELIKRDIKSKSMWGIFDGKVLIAVSFAGARCEDGEEDFTWKDSFKKRGTFARIGVAPQYQNQGVGTMFVKFILETLQAQGFDGVRILVETQNVNAIKLYQKFGFVNCGTTTRYGHEYYLFELRVI